MYLRTVGLAMAAALLAGAVFVTSFGPASADTKKATQAEQSVTKKVVRDKKLTTAGAAVTCCTNFQFGGSFSGCATFEDSCPANQFQADCSKDTCN